MVRRVKYLVLLLALMLPQLRLAGAEPVDAQAIRHVLDAQVAAWNRGDIDAFMRGYKDAPDTAFVGKEVQHGYASILDRYKKKYQGKEQMGTLRFEGLEIRLLDAHYAVVTGHFHLSRGAQAGGDAAGVFSLVLQRTHTEQTSPGWKIVLDHTS